MTIDSVGHYFAGEDLHDHSGIKRHRHGIPHPTVTGNTDEYASGQMGRSTAMSPTYCRLSRTPLTETGVTQTFTAVILMMAPDSITPSDVDGVRLKWIPRNREEPQ